MTVAITGGTLIDVRTGAQHPRCTVLIENDRIVSVDTTGTANVPSNVEVSDAGDAWLVPGLIDMHAHTTGINAEYKEKLLPLYLAYGVTTVRDTGGNLTQLRLLRDDIAAGRKVGPRLYFAGPLLDGLPPVWPPISILVDTTARARSAVEFLAQQGVDLIKVYNWVPEDSLATILETAHRLGLPVTGHSTLR